ncbi:response regulator transcription factor [Dictyobacter kobayashii]|uniref:DNA-binding response regulator n=1 Tax=Dictyobacter kobayashii TaxID=2014872 RepID=A0A402AHK4_9CHLR|nr:response regulator transcription factor [Dictyobacter kobayashii]GCE18612.1 DNA-binding response regulator [Dictyobacter kobayashii]
MASILVVEDEIDICNLIRKELESQGHQVYQAFDGEAALSIVDKLPLNLVILDWMLPKLDGLTVCRTIRQNHLMPIIMLTARTDEVDRILGLEVGADDYISKPFSVRELTARVRAMLRRIDLDTHFAPGSAGANLNSQAHVSTGTEKSSTPGVPPISMTGLPSPIIRGDLYISLSEHTVTLEKRTIDLTPKEYELLVLLSRNPGRAFSREYLLQELWGYDYDGFDRTVDTHITRLRKKLGPLGEKIMTVWGVGYRFVI